MLRQQLEDTKLVNDALQDRVRTLAVAEAQALAKKAVTAVGNLHAAR